MGQLFGKNVLMKFTLTGLRWRFKLHPATTKNTITIITNNDVSKNILLLISLQFSNKRIKKKNFISLKKYCSSLNKTSRLQIVRLWMVLNHWDLTLMESTKWFVGSFTMVLYYIYYGKYDKIKYFVRARYHFWRISKNIFFWGFVKWTYPCFEVSILYK